MGWSSFDDFITEATANGKVWRQDFVKTLSNPSVAYVAGNCYDWAIAPGSPVQNLYPGVTLVAQTPTDIGVGGGIYHGGNTPAGNTKHLVNMGAYSAIATAVPSILQLCDTVMYYPTLDAKDTGSKTLVNANTFTGSSSTGLLLTYTNDFASFTSVKFSNAGGALPVGLNNTDIFYLVRVGATSARVATSLANAIAGTVVAYTDDGTGTHTMTVTPNRYADGAGLRAYVVVTVQSGNPATTPTFVMTYYNQTGAEKSIGATIRFTVGGTNIPQVGKIAHSGVAANNYGFFLPLAAGDSGIRGVKTFQISPAYTTATTVTMALVLVKPICTIPIVAASVAAERNLFTQLPSLPRIYDHACLNFLQFAGGATALNTPIQGYIDTAWG
jgi:hypothetical protein